MKKKDITLTPLSIINSLTRFDLDPCAFEGHDTADNMYILPLNDGLKDKWFGRVWLNPPYSETKKWIKRLSEHNNGIACVLASTETEWFQEYVLKKANGILFLKSRPKFLDKNFKVVNLMRGVVLVSYGKCKSLLQGSKLKGVFIELNTQLSGGTTK